MGEVIGNLTPFSNWKNDKHICTTSVTALSDVSVICRSVRIMSRITNTGKIYIGSANMDTSNASIYLDAGESVDIEIDNLNKIFCIAEVNNERVQYSWTW